MGTQASGQKIMYILIKHVIKLHRAAFLTPKELHLSSTLPEYYQYYISPPSTFQNYNTNNSSLVKFPG